MLSSRNATNLIKPRGSGQREMLLCRNGGKVSLRLAVSRELNGRVSTGVTGDGMEWEYFYANKTPGSRSLGQQVSLLVGTVGEGTE